MKMIHEQHQQMKSEKHERKNQPEHSDTAKQVV
jgi:hypothetical protein